MSERFDKEKFYEVVKDRIADIKAKVAKLDSEIGNLKIQQIVKGGKTVFRERSRADAKERLCNF